MSGRDLLTDERRVFEELCTTEWLEAGFRNVKKTKGSPGIDGVTWIGGYVLREEPCTDPYARFCGHCALKRMKFSSLRWLPW